jgi:hypothetical protein
MLGLLAFVLALTLSFANSRFSERIQGTLNEANAIGTAWLRPRRSATQGDLRWQNCSSNICNSEESSSPREAIKPS